MPPMPSIICRSAAGRLRGLDVLRRDVDVRHRAGDDRDGLRPGLGIRADVTLEADAERRRPGEHGSDEIPARIGIDPRILAELLGVVVGEEDVVRRPPARRRAERAADVADGSGADLDECLAARRHARRGAEGDRVRAAEGRVLGPGSRPGDRGRRLGFEEAAEPVFLRGHPLEPDLALGVGRGGEIGPAHEAVDRDCPGRRPAVGVEQSDPQRPAFAAGADHPDRLVQPCEGRDRHHGHGLIEWLLVDGE